MAVQDYQAPDLDELLENHRKWAEHFTEPKPLGIEKAVAIVTCMDGRLMPARQFGLNIGDAEYIRNAGGRVTADVIRSLVLAIELLKVKMVIVMHHTDCGAQAAHRHHDMLIEGVKERLGVDLSDYNMLPIGESTEDLAQSVVEDVEKLRSSPLISPNVIIAGYVYDTQTAELTEIVRSMSRHEGIESSTLKISAEGFEGTSPGSDEQQSGTKSGSQQQADKQTKKPAQQSEKQSEEQSHKVGGQQDISAGADSSGDSHKGSTGQGGADKPESVIHLAEALKEAHFDDPDPPAAQP